jgi:hypothetical protein
LLESLEPRQLFALAPQDIVGLGALAPPLDDLTSDAGVQVVVPGNGNTDAASLFAAGGPGDPDLPGFDNVGRTNSGATAIYLGGGWCLTANHVGITTGVVFDGIGYYADPASVHQLHNADSTVADLKLFRIFGDPDLPTISPDFVASAPPSGHVFMIGNGQSLAAGEHFWSVNTSVNPWVWTEIAEPPIPGPNNAAGYVLSSPNVVRWGENMVEDTGLYLNLGSGIFITAFTTQFDDLPYTGQIQLPGEAQGSVGDSGGAVFAFQGGQWVLSGIMVAITGPSSGQPNNTIVYGDQTYMADLSAYRDEIFSIAGVLGREIFYNNSKFDGNTPNASASDDAAIATDKTAYLPGSGASTFENITSYARGINGVMIDLASSHGPLTAGDFSFRIGDSNAPSGWVAAPAPLSLTVRASAGAGGTDRVEIIWADGEIANTWLEVIVEGDDAVGGFNTNTGLAYSDVFYFGNRIGDTGSGTATLAITSATDELATRNNIGAGSLITNVFDFDRNGVVSALDPIISRGNAGTLTKINLTSPPASPVDEEGALADLALALAERPSATMSGARSQALPELTRAPSRRSLAARHALERDIAAQVALAIDALLVGEDDAWLDDAAVSRPR